MKKVTLNNGVEMPVLGFGVFQVTDAVAGLDKKVSSFFDHRDPEMVKWLVSRKLTLSEDSYLQSTL